jgi:hypothetical protein
MSRSSTSHAFIFRQKLLRGERDGLHVNSGDDSIMSQGSRMAPSPSVLTEGQRLDQPTFHALYEVMPPAQRAELINGVVYMPKHVCMLHGMARVGVIV